MTKCKSRRTAFNVPSLRRAATGSKAPRGATTAAPDHHFIRGTTDRRSVVHLIHHLLLTSHILLCSSCRPVPQPAEQDARGAQGGGGGCQVPEGGASPAGRAAEALQHHDGRPQHAAQVVCPPCVSLSPTPLRRRPLQAPCLVCTDKSQKACGRARRTSSASRRRGRRT